MLLWHLGAVIFLFRWIFRDPKVDFRFLALGAVLPDVIDLSVVTVAGGTQGELWAHSLAMPTLIAAVVLLTTRRGRRRRAWMALVVAWLFHLLVDGMWTDGRVFLWPVFGWALPVGSGAFWSGAWERALSDPWRWVLELVGLAYLIWLARAARVSEEETRAELGRTGRLRLPDR
ncbi:MAG: metal-dependent hydrolase [Acidimicrobiia bacterium]